MQQIINKIIEEKLIVIVRGVYGEELLKLAEAMYNGGIRLLEITYSADGKVSDEETAKSISVLAEKFEGRMLIGAGTVITTKQVELTKNAGGKFIISPDTNSEVIECTKKLGMISIPGALTPSEITEAHRAGADFVKLFPVFVYGHEYIKAVKAPLSNVRFLAVGGVGLDNMEEYYKAGACGFGIGTSIVDRELLNKNDFKEIEAQARAYVEKAKAL